MRAPWRASRAAAGLREAVPPQGRHRAAQSFKLVHASRVGLPGGVPTNDLSITPHNRIVSNELNRIEKPSGEYDHSTLFTFITKRSVTPSSILVIYHAARQSI